jgi:hypothetical protein
LWTDPKIIRRPDPVTLNPNDQTFDVVSVGATNPTPVTNRADIQTIVNANVLTACTQKTHFAMSMKTNKGNYSVEFDRELTNVNPDTKIIESNSSLP